MFETIKNYPKYEINENGTIREIETQRELPTYFNGSSIVVRLKKDSVSITCNVAKLVAITFLEPNENENKYVNHVIKYLDGNHQNIHVSNLSWTTMGNVCKEAKRDMSSLMTPVKAYNIHETLEFESISEAARAMGVKPASIARCLKDSNAKCNGYSWIRIEK